MKNYDKILEFYSLLLELVKWNQFDRDIAEKAIQIYEQIKKIIRVKDFDMKFAENFYGGDENLDVREDVLQLAFQDLAPHLRDPKAQEVIRGLYDSTGSLGEDLYLHIKNVRLFDASDPKGPAVITIIVDSYEGFKDLIAKDDTDRPDCVHVSMDEKVSL
jgi:hypothetical protein